MIVDMTHGSGSVDLVPAAEDEAGLGVVHSEGLTERWGLKKRKEQRQAVSRFSVCEENIKPNI